MRIKKVIKNFFILYSYLSSRRKIQTYLIILLMTASSILEVFSIGMIVPFTAVLLDPSSLNNLILGINLIDLININQLFIMELLYVHYINY